ncbi:putative RNA 2'-phosphotransferase [Lacibacter cauensis]|uniref:Probable RNA 2'-phosphotransferase n=1 Tax=Lacibacter cauensis TaxID=510947 RepID=A0A562SR74_9BACT|nr:RNA 2'-phosphotransferase [Lacibacter cauensis]TWI83280.1 putative RNA 2'-phosphotransferase [Lacibacter cauensis]
MEKNLKHLSKFLSLILRHKPETIGLQLNENGWANVQELISKINQHNTALDSETLNHIVETNDKKRFAFNEDKTMIRASQGHSVEVELNLKEMQPPQFLYHGTVQAFMEAIQKEGLKKMSRQHVHLSNNQETATKVGSRRGKPVILIINAAAMHADSYAFFLSDNGVWLTDHVPAQYIQL